jgi:chromosome segregation ATPase
MAVDAEAKLTVERELAALRQKQAELDKRQADLAEGIQEINGYLAEIQRGGKPPEGFTEGELKDRLGDHQEQARALDKEEEELRARMKEKEEILAQGKVPPQDKTLHTQELEAAKELKARVGALEAKLK